MGDSPNIQVFNESGQSIPIKESDFTKIATAFQKEEGCSFNFVEVVYVDEDEIIRLNKEHLDRNYVTDIITFRYDDPAEDSEIEGTMFCCAPRILEQAKELNEPVEREFKRIYVHGLLHLAGYNDENSSQKEQMTAKENAYLDLI
jgi:rRNA maturation RNase YbeY